MQRLGVVLSNMKNKSHDHDLHEIYFPHQNENMKDHLKKHYLNFNPAQLIKKNCFMLAAFPATNKAPYHAPFTHPNHKMFETWFIMHHL